MKIVTSMLLFAFVSSMPVYAHDPREHHRDAAQAADCSKMKDMDLSKMDKDDPVLRALLKKCKIRMNSEARDRGRR